MNYLFCRIRLYMDIVCVAFMGYGDEEKKKEKENTRKRIHIIDPIILNVIESNPTDCSEENEVVH